VAIVCSEGAFIDGLSTSISVTDIIFSADTVVTSRFVDALGKRVTSMGFISAFVDFWIAFFAIAIESIVTDAFISADFAAIGSLFWNTGGIRVAAVHVVCTIVWFVTRVGSESFKVWNEFLIPAIITFKLDLGDNILKTVCPHTGSRVTIVVNMTTADVTGEWVAFNGTMVLGFITKSVEFGGNSFPSGNGFLNTVGSLHGNFFKFLVGESRVFVKVAHTVIKIVWMCAF